MISINGLTQIKDAGIGKRFAAMLIDLWLIAFLSNAFLICVRWLDGKFLIHKIFGIEGNFAVVGAFDAIRAFKGLNAVDIVFAVLAMFIYFSFSDRSAWKGSPGKRMLGLRVVTSSGRRLTASASIYRTSLFLMSGLMIGVPYITAFYSRKNQTKHDQITKSRVIEIQKINSTKAGSADSLESLKSSASPLMPNRASGFAERFTGRLKGAWINLHQDAVIHGASKATGAMRLTQPWPLFAVVFILLIVALVWFFSRGGAAPVQAPLKKPSLAAAGAQAMKLAMPMMKAAATYNNEMGRLPEGISPPVMSPEASKGISKIEYRKSSGQIVINMELGQDLNKSKATILFGPNFSNGKLVSWGCGAYGFESGDRPASCSGVITP